MGRIIDAILVKGLPKKDIKNANRVDLWAVVWALSMIFSSVLIESGWLTNPYLVVAASLFVLGVGIRVALAYKYLLLTLDEMERKIQYDALALAVGVSIVGFSGYAVLEHAELVPTLQSFVVVSGLAVTYAIGLIIGRIRLA
ncbi:MAG TPA: hypothetical protein DE179_09645 [Oceanospirillaceae bacterium]|nr:hypothetical protein [Oceanospirillaceae bacterium]